MDKATIEELNRLFSQTVPLIPTNPFEALVRNRWPEIYKALVNN